MERVRGPFAFHGQILPRVEGPRAAKSSKKAPDQPGLQSETNVTNFKSRCA